MRRSLIHDGTDLAAEPQHQSAQVRKGHEDPSLQDGEDEEDTGLTATGRKKRRRTGESNAKKRKKGAEAMLH